MGTVGRIANGISNDLISRAADVIIKERKKLIIVPRETPFSSIHLNNLKIISENGGVVIPATPSFYNKPKTIIELVDTVQLNKANFSALENINTKNLEFSPTFYDGGLVFVSSSPKGKSKVDINIGEAFFTLKFADFDSIGNITVPEDFSMGLKVKNHLGPCAFTKDENLIFLSRNKKGVVIVDGAEKDVNPMGIYLYIKFFIQHGMSQIVV